MSLRVWLPLNGDLHNQGLSNITVTNNGATVNTSGKIGSCYYFNGSAQYLQFSDSLGNIYSNDFSWAVWLKPTDDTRGIIISEYSSTGASNVAFELLANRVIRVYWNGSPDWSFSAIPKDVWSHVAITKHVNTIKVYINGVESGSKTTTLSARPSTAKIRIGDDYRGGTSVSYMGYMNDVRIYDHALSELEIKEIARAKVLHYPLNQFLPYQSVKYDKNIYTEPDGSKWLHIIHHNNPNGGVFSSTNTWENGVYIDENRWFDFYPIIRILNTYEFMVKQKTTSSATEVKYRWIQNKSPLTATYNDIQPSNVTRITTTGYTDGNYGGLYVTNSNSHLCIANTQNGNWYGAFGCWTVYQNGIPGYPNTVVTTGYMDLYVKISDYISSTIEYDISGYCNNGTIVNSLTTIIPSPKFNCATHFNGSAYIYTTSPCAEVKTLSLWVKWDTIPSGQSVVFLDAKSHIGLGLMSTGILCVTSGLGNGNTFSKANLVANTWYHFVVVNPGGTTDIPRKLYINGIEQTATSNTSNWTYSIDQTQIGKRSTTSDGFVGSLSDVKMYATALSAQDVLDLYNNSNS